MWHVSSRSGVATLRTAIHLLLTYVAGMAAETLLDLMDPVRWYVAVLLLDDHGSHHFILA